MKTIFLFLFKAELRANVFLALEEQDALKVRVFIFHKSPYATISPFNFDYQENYLIYLFKFELLI